MPELLESRIWLERANLLQLSNQLDGLDTLLKVHSEYPDSFEASLALSDVYYLKQMYAESNQYLLEALKRSQNQCIFI